jgi:pilus assembly protein Flp/PilA
VPDQRRPTIIFHALTRFPKKQCGILPIFWISAGMPAGKGGVRIMLETFRRILRDESGATAIEYGLIAAGISVAIIAVVNGMGTKLKTTFSSISSQLKKSAPIQPHPYKPDLAPATRLAGAFR